MPRILITSLLALFALFAGVYYWFPKMTGRMMSDFWGKVHFWTSLVFMNMIFQPMFAQGMEGMLRRMYDGAVNYSAATNAQLMGGVEQALAGGAISDAMINANRTISFAAWMLAIAQIPFILNLFYSIRKGKPANSDNPWGSTTLEWQTPTPPPHGNFAVVPTVHRGPYEYSVPGHARDFTPQSMSDAAAKKV